MSIKNDTITLSVEQEIEEETQRQYFILEKRE